MWNLLKNKNQKKTPLKRSSFEKQMYIPKKTLQKKERTVPGVLGRSSGEKNQKVSWWRRGFIIFLWLLFVCELVYILLFTKFFIPVTVLVAAAPPELAVEQFVREHFEGKYFEVVPKANLLIISTQKLEHLLAARYPRLKNIRVEKKLPETILVYTEVLPYQFLWCKQEECLLLTEEGLLKNADAFFKYRDEQGSVYTVRDESNRTLTLDHRVFTKEEVNFLKEVIRDFESRTGLKREGDFVVPSLYTKELRIHTEEGFWVYFSTQQDLQKTMSNLVLFLEKEIPKEERGQLEYIDLRTENRVYYTRKDRQPENPKEEEKPKAGEENASNPQP
jgi:hypothetical protein